MEGACPVASAVPATDTAITATSSIAADTVIPATSSIVAAIADTATSSIAADIAAAIAKPMVATAGRYDIAEPDMAGVMVLREMRAVVRVKPYGKKPG